MITFACIPCPSMKVPPKRKGNKALDSLGCAPYSPLNESPSEKEGKSRLFRTITTEKLTLNESPSEKEGKSGDEPSAPQV